jgi:hypothetical protein
MKIFETWGLMLLLAGCFLFRDFCGTFVGLFLKPPS